jgi:hypothetical protein
MMSATLMTPVSTWTAAISGLGCAIPTKTI